jgi:hypothetical protein
VGRPMAAMPPVEPPGTGVPAPPGAAGGGPEGQRQARYNALLGRLRSRQITMEEATELFAIMQAMLRASELAARRASAGAVAPPPPVTGLPSMRAPRTPVAASSAPDDMFLVGLLAMGAGAGLLAAMARRLGDAAGPADGDKRTEGRRDA